MTRGRRPENPLRQWTGVAQGGVDRRERNRQHDHLTECRRLRIGSGRGAQSTGRVEGGLAAAEHDLVAALAQALAERAAEAARAEDSDLHRSDTIDCRR